MFVFCCKNLRFKLSLLEKKISYTEAILITLAARDLPAQLQSQGDPEKMITLFLIYESARGSDTYVQKKECGR
jgi:hypothetical protein